MEEGRTAINGLDRMQRSRQMAQDDDEDKLLGSRQVGLVKRREGQVR